MREFEHYPMLLNMNQPGRNRLESAWRIVFAIAAVAICAPPSHRLAHGPTIPTRLSPPSAITKSPTKDLDAKVQPQLVQMRAALEKRVDQLIADKTFDLRRETLESMTDDYLVQQAADQDKLSVPEYLKKEFCRKRSPSPTPRPKAFYDKNKGPGTAPYDKIKPQLLQMMNRQALLDRLRKDQPVKILLEPKRVVVDSSGHPALGAKDAPVTIVEFTDFQCPFCKASEATLKQLRDKVRRQDSPRAHGLPAAVPCARA